MPSFKTRRRVRHKAGDMFRLVADIEAYPEFVPLCKTLKIISHKEKSDTQPETITARMTVAYKFLQESFTSRVKLFPEDNSIEVEYIDGPFKFLHNKWVFEPFDENECFVEFYINYEFKSRTFSNLVGAIFDRAFRKFASAFEQRADRLYA